MTITLTREEAQSVLDALEEITRHFSFSRLGESRLADTTARGKAHEAAAALRARLAQPEREWQGLTDEEVFAALVAVDGNTKRLAPGFVAFYCAIEAKLKEKNT